MKTDWKITGEKLAMKVTVPANSTATVYLPGKYTEGDVDRGMLKGEHAGRTVVELPAGTYRMSSELLAATR